MGTVVVDVAAINEFMATPDGPAMRYLLTVGDRVKAGTVARLRAGFPQDFVGPRVVKRMEVVNSGPQAGPHVYVGADKLRTRPHRIDGRPVLVFNWPKAGRVVFLRHVNHPGSDLTAYLARTLLKALGAARGSV